MIINKKMKKAPLFSSPITRTLTTVLASLLISVVITAAMPVYLPFNQGDRIAGPTLLFPFLWLGLFVYSATAVSMTRVWTVLGCLLVSHLGLIAWALTGG
ncbi:MAG: hypothetical protein ACRBBW_02200 [Cellvibrionaceae bacterium]